MVNIENLFNNAFRTIKTEPKVLLPLVLNWIPAAIISVAVSIMASDFISNYTFDKMISVFKKDAIGFMLQFLEDNSLHLGLIIVAASLSIFISSFVNAVYPTISYQIYYRKKILITEAVSTAKQRYLKVLWTNIMFSILSMFAIFGTIILAALLFAGLAVVGGIAGILLGLLTSIVAIFIFIALIAYLSPMQVLLEPIVVIENIYGLSAIERSYGYLKGRLFEIWIFIILLIIANALYFAMAGLIAGVAGFILGSYTGIIEMILMLLPSAFILLSYGLLYLEIAPASLINLSDSPVPYEHPQEQNSTPLPQPGQPTQSYSSQD